MRIGKELNDRSSFEKYLPNRNSFQLTYFSHQVKMFNTKILENIALLNLRILSSMHGVPKLYKFKL